jgi:phosphoribosylamine--glycine ligase
MITKDGPKVIEFNNRFGDPETQVVLPRLENDLLDIFLAVTEDRLAAQDLRWSRRRAVCVVLAAKGYPGGYEKGKIVSGSDRVEEGVFVFHAGTKRGGAGEILTAGGRVLGVTALGDTHDEARRKAYENVARIDFDGMGYRKDIGLLKDARE